MTTVSGRLRLYWLVKESNVHLSLYMIQLDNVTSFSDDSQQLCYIQAHAASVTLHTYHHHHHHHRHLPNAVAALDRL